MSAELVLGTAQLGMNYGIANQDGKPSASSAYDILRTARDEGVSTFDTALDYGGSEEIIGQFLADHPQDVTIITKLPSVHSKIENKEEEQIERYVKRILKNSLQRLGQKKVEYYLLHDEKDLPILGGKLCDALRSQKEADRIGHFGVSVYSPRHAKAAIIKREIEALQLPFNVFDRRFEEIARNGKDAGVTIFARSVFLQGLFFLSPNDAESKVPGAGEPIQRLQQLAQEFDRSISEIALCFVRDSTAIDGLVVGVDNLEQLKQNVDLMSRPSLSRELRTEIKAAFSDIPDCVVNPIRW